MFDAAWWGLLGQTRSLNTNLVHIAISPYCSTNIVVNRETGKVISHHLGSHLNLQRRRRFIDFTVG
jgi:hypothetical protein